MKSLAGSGLAAFLLLSSFFPAAARDRATLRTTGPPASPGSDRPYAPAGESFESNVPAGAHLPVTGGMDLGVGIYAVSGHFVRDRQTTGREPIAGTAGRQNKVAAVGFSLRF
jgi:hypothetical protein